jgi:hypothetical protein
MAIASLIISIFAALAAMGSTLYARHMWLIERARYHAGRQPRLSAIYEDFDGYYPGLEITNDGNEDLVDVKIELRDPIPPYHPAITAISGEERSKTPDDTWMLHSNQAGRTVDLGALAVSETKRILIHRDDPIDQFGEAILHAHCSAADGSEWRIAIKADIPKGRPEGN